MSAEALFAEGMACLSANRFDDALSAFARAARLDPGLDGLAYRIGTTLAALGRLPEAARHLYAALAADPGHAESYSNLAIALLNGNFPDTDPILTLLRRALALAPDLAAVHANIGLVLAERGDPDLADAFNRRAAELDPSPRMWSRMLFNLNYRESLTAEACEAEHRRVGALFASMPAPALPRSGQRRRLGFVSPDFRAHSVSYFLLPLLEALDRRRFEVYCYADVARPDAVTARIRGLADHWRDTASLPDSDLDARIRRDGVETLIDLAGHTPGNRLAVFARRPAPVQMSWLGYANITGLEAIDYRIVDGITDPADPPAGSGEVPLRLPDGFLCYQPPAHAPAVAAPSRRPQTIFGTFNNPTKIGAGTIALWAEILIRRPEAKFLVKSYKLRDRALRDLIAARFAGHGVSGERLILEEGVADPAAHLASYEKIDVALDPLLYNGTATTCEALWMGVPVLTLRGDRHAGRVGASLLTRLGPTGLVAETPMEYVETACRLAADFEARAALRTTLRARMAASPLCDAQGFARHFEKASTAEGRNAAC